MSCPSPSTKLAIGSPCLTSCQYDFPNGTFCENNVVKACPAGSYCEISPFRPFQPMKRTCPEGKYCPVGTRIPISCLEDGTYCPLGSAAPINCEPGYFCNNLHEYHNQCPQGRYCPGKTGPGSLPCPAGYDPEGTFAGQGVDKNGGGAAACTDCPPGTYCPPPVGEGYYKLRHPTYGLISTIKNCPEGTFCPNAKTTVPTKCGKKTWCPEGSAVDTACSSCPSRSWPSCGSSWCNKAGPTSTCCDVLDNTYNAPKCPAGWVSDSTCTQGNLFKVRRCTRQSCK